MFIDCSVIEETPLDETREWRRRRCCLPCNEYLRMEGAEEDGGGGGGVDVDDVAVTTELALSSSEVRAATQRSRSGPFCKKTFLSTAWGYMGWDSMGRSVIF